LISNEKEGTEVPVKSARKKKKKSKALQNAGNTTETQQEAQTKARRAAKTEGKPSIAGSSPPMRASSSKQRVPETIIDPSIPIASRKSKMESPTDATAGPSAKHKARKRKADDSSDEEFKDSRGTGPRLSFLLISSGQGDT
jgi:hypothetical protein